ncbi:MAG: hypothetical protein OHK0029_14530 [Armatimonadaceae bacterium]
MPTSPQKTPVQTILTEPTRTEVHILLSCADARDSGLVHRDAVNTVVEQYAQRGVRAEYHALRVPGSFVTLEVLSDIRSIVADAEERHFHLGTPIQYHVYIQAHGVLLDAPEGYSVLNAAALHIKEGSPLNCGMLGATGVGMELEALLLERHPEVRLPSGRTLAVNTEEDIRTLLREVYGHDGYLAGDWVVSIDDLRTHSRRQKGVLERAIAADPNLRRLGITVSAGIQDHENHRSVRLECGANAGHFWDEVHEYIRARFRELGDDHPDFFAQRQKQTPIAGMFAMDSGAQSPRDLAAEHYARQKGLEHTQYRANSLFVLGGSTFDQPRSPFSPYIVAGYYYAAASAHLNVSDFLVVGENDAQTERMMAKIQNDPLMRLITEDCQVNLLPLTAQTLTGTAAEG